MSTPPTVDQMRNITDRAYSGQLQPAEIARLRQGIDLLAQKRSARRRRGAPLAAARRLQRLKQRLRGLHAPILRGGVEVCRECSGWDGVRCRGLVTPYPCRTVEAFEGAQAGADGPQGVQEAPGAAEVRAGNFGEAAA